MENLTVKQWIIYFPKPIRKQVEANINNWDLKAYELKSTTLKNALFIAFPWKNSNEGYEYWNNIYTDYTKH